MLEVMPWRVFSRWKRYYEIDPFGEERADLRGAIIAWTVATMMSDKKNRRRLTLESFIPKFARRRESPERKAEQKAEREAQRMLEKIKTINAMFGGNVVKLGADGE